MMMYVHWDFTWSAESFGGRPHGIISPESHTFPCLSCPLFPRRASITKRAGRTLASSQYKGMDTCVVGPDVDVKPASYSYIQLKCLAKTPVAAQKKLSIIVGSISIATGALNHVSAMRPSENKGRGEEQVRYLNMSVVLHRSKHDDSFNGCF